MLITCFIIDKALQRIYTHSFHPFVNVNIVNVNSCLQCVQCSVIRYRCFVALWGTYGALNGLSPLQSRDARSCRNVRRSGRSMIAHWTHCSVSRCLRPALSIVVNDNVKRSYIVCSWIKLMFDHRITQSIRITVILNDNASSFIVLHIRLNDKRALWSITCMLNAL